jgi:hypothetical protein
LTRTDHAAAELTRARIESSWLASALSLDGASALAFLSCLERSAISLRAFSSFSSASLSLALSVSLSLSVLRLFDDDAAPLDDAPDLGRDLWPPERP